MPETITLSESALALLRLHVERKGQIAVDDDNREPYRELEAAGLMLLGRPFTGAPQYHLTREGFERKAELLVGAVATVLAHPTSPSPEESSWPPR